MAPGGLHFLAVFEQPRIPASSINELTIPNKLSVPRGCAPPSTRFLTSPSPSQAVLSKLDRSAREEGQFHWAKRAVFRFSQTTPPRSVQINSKKNQIGSADLRRREARTGRLTNPIDLGRPTGSSVGSTSRWKRTSCSAP